MKKLTVNNYDLGLCRDKRHAACLIAYSYELNTETDYMNVLADLALTGRFIVEVKGKETRIYKIE